MVTVPAYKELAVCKIWKEVKDDPVLSLYFCEEYADGKYPERSFFWNVLNTFHSQYVTRLVRHAQDQRNAASGTCNNDEVIEIADEWLEEL